MNYLVVGQGAMGRLVKQALETAEDEKNRVDSVNLAREIPCQAYDGLIDFSHPENLEGIVEHLQNYPCPAVLATTGYSAEQVEKIHDLARHVPLVYSGNYSVGVLVMKRLVTEMQQLVGHDFDIEIIEKHHRKKIDAPSGTAKMLAESLRNGETQKIVYGREGVSPRRPGEIGLHSIRGGTIVGEHEVIFAGEDEILSMKHEALSKMIFVKGAVRALKWLQHQPPGFYSMEDVIFGKKA